MIQRTYANRELSWLDFNRRVLAIAQDPGTPVLERAKFLAIFSSNLDEFFQVRVAGLKTRIAAGVGSTGGDGLTAAGTLAEIHRIAEGLYKELTDTFRNEVVPELARNDIAYSEISTLDDGDRTWLDEQFRSRVFPVLTPLAVDPAHPFPYISDLSLSLAVFVRHPGMDDLQFARVKVPPILPRFVVMPDGERFVPLEQVIARHLDELFPGMEIVSHCPFRVTRDNDIEVDARFDVDDDADDLLEAIESQLVRRRFGAAVRLEAERHLDHDALDLIARELELGEDDIYLMDGPLDMTGLWALYDLDRPDLRWEPYQAVSPPAFAAARSAGRDTFSMMRDTDVLVHHPYESFASSVEEFIADSAADPRVLTIKMTMYRTAKDSPIARSLIKAAEAGKQVVVLVELQARFDELANIEWAKVLERAGVHVAYGVLGLKTHCKTALVVRDEGRVMRRYAHIGTGNYNSTTARLYEDLGLFTADDDIGADLSDLFNVLTGFSSHSSYRRLVVSPHTTRDRILELIAAEAAHADGHIVMKMNSLVDREVIDALHDAVDAGTRLELLIRGICCFVPPEGCADRVVVRSIVGRYLEHSRIFRFGRPDRSQHYLIGSADMMPRNLDSRVEALVPVRDPRLRSRIDQMIEVELADNQRAWRLDSGGRWHKIERPADEEPLEAQVVLQDLTVSSRFPST